MNPLTLEWVEKPEGNLVMLQRELRARISPNYDGACFHAQQCAEKYLKARLQEANIRFSKTHNLVELLNILLPIEPSWASMVHDLQFLSAFAVDPRYPGSTKLDRKATLMALSLCRRVRGKVRASLGLPP